MTAIQEFLALVDKQAENKKDLYDGYNSSWMNQNNAIVCLVEEVGEVADASLRKRYLLAMAECVDVAHCAFLVWNEIRKEIDRVV